METTHNIYSEEFENVPALKELISKKIGDKVSLSLPIEALKQFIDDDTIDFEDETQMDVTIEIDAIT